MWSYDRERLVQLRGRTIDAVYQLGALNSTDPEAGEAINAVRSTAATLEHDWLRLIDSIVSSGLLMRDGPQLLGSTSWLPSWWSTWSTVEWPSGAFASEPTLSCSLPGGDPGGTFSYEARAPFVVVGGTGAERGRDVIVRALHDTANGSQIHQDEFEIVQVGATEYVVVLPGVTDLSTPHLGLDPLTRTVRDVDVDAFPSWAAAGIANNRYATMVRDAMVEIGVPSGANVMIVGHSYGADTALDLAADHDFNGPDGYRVTHVVAAAFDSEPQLPLVPSSTEVLVLQNNIDVAVMIERAGRGPLSALEEVDDIIDEITDREYRRLAERGAGAPAAAGRVVWDAAWTMFDATGDLVVDLPEIASDVWDRDMRRLIEDLPGPVREPGVNHPTRSQTVVVFSGGTEGVGHHQDNYVDYLSGPDAAPLTSYFASVAAAGYGVTGRSYAVDISVPERN